MRIALGCALLVACVSARKQSSPPAPAATATAGSTPSTAPAPKEKSPDPPPAAAGPMTAAEAAAQLAAQHGSAGDATMASAGVAASADGGAATDEARCETDDDCTFTRTAAGACCPMLCEPRAVTKKEAEALDAQVRACSPGHRCPTPLCRAPRFSTMPACVQSHCIAKPRANEN